MGGKLRDTDGAVLTEGNAPQETVVEGIYKEGLRGLRSIIDPESGECIGHFVFYKSDKGIKVLLFDPDLQPTHEVALHVAADGKVGSAVYNGTALAFIVYENAGSFSLFSISTNGEVIGSKSFTYSHEFTGVDLLPCTSDGGYYLLAQVSDGKSTGYQILKLSSDIKTIWDQRKYPEHGYLIADAAISLPGQLIVIQRESEAVSYSRNVRVKPDLVCYDEGNGDLLFTSPLYDKDYLAIPNQLIADKEGNIVIAGEYYEGERIKSDNSDGVFFKKLSASGDVLTYNLLSWEKGIQKQLAKTKLKLTGKNKVYFHNISLTDDGGYQVIAETFATSVGRKLLTSGLAMLGGDYEAIAESANQATCLAARSSGRYLGEPTEKEAPVTISAQDFLIFHFDAEGQLEEVTKIEKEYTKIFIYDPYMYVGGLKLARMINEFGFMDYAFCIRPEGSEQAVLIANCANASPKHFAIINITKGEEKKVRKIPIFEIGVNDDGRKPEMVGVVPGARGSMVIYYLSKGDKDNLGALHMYKETINNE
ncbi:MAG: hypothetical protein A2X11_12680 [Bacteroidetes bacterium GWE2_42_24]|nr:MAG: hypothetical protein A2X11_12680 [Bacteroidetes bacterium GWE2_42_24]OFY30631.1 MAG: hypothetical protein A2X09_03930 [Bacteroidetes bacterium GWF2_43_11]